MSRRDRYRYRERKKKKQPRGIYYRRSLRRGAVYSSGAWLPTDYFSGERGEIAAPICYVCSSRLLPLLLLLLPIGSHLEFIEKFERRAPARARVCVLYGGECARPRKRKLCREREVVIPCGILIGARIFFFFFSKCSGP